MTPQDQEFLKTATMAGDCQRAVLASLMDLPIAEVPHFAQLAAESKDSSYSFWAAVYDFCESRGYVYKPHVMLIYHLREGVDLYHQISGPSPRGNGVWHAVVGLNGEVFFDPHPSRAGLAGNPLTWHHSVLLKETK